MQRHRHQEFIRFLNVTEAAVPKGNPEGRSPPDHLYAVDKLIHWR